MSILSSPHAISAALRRADDLIGPNRQWSPTNDQQRAFLKIYAIARNEVARVPEIESIASWNAADIDRFLHQRGFSLSLPPFRANHFGLAAALDLLLNWLLLVPGTELPLVTPDGETYPGVLLSSPARGGSVPGHNNPVVSIPTRSRDEVYLTMLDSAPVDELALVATARRLAADLELGGHAEVHFPKVALDVTAELGWLSGLWTRAEDGQRTELAYAARQTRVHMNELGVHIEEAWEFQLVAGLGPFEVPRYVINRPFLMWVTRPGLTLPLFVGYITRDAWKDPGSL